MKCTLALGPALRTKPCPAAISRCPSAQISKCFPSQACIAMPSPPLSSSLAPSLGGCIVPDAGILACAAAADELPASRRDRAAAAAARRGRPAHLHGLVPRVLWHHADPGAGLCALPGGRSGEFRTRGSPEHLIRKHTSCVLILPVEKSEREDATRPRESRLPEPSPRAVSLRLHPHDKGRACALLKA